MDGVNYYQLFSLSPDATQDELKNSYRRLSLTHHPDRGGSTEQMARLNEAYRTLSNPLLRRAYDQKLTRPATHVTPGEAEYHYTHAAQAHRTAPSEATQQYASFWRRFLVLAIFGAVFLAYDIMTVVVLPSMVKQAPHGTGMITAPAEETELRNEINAAISEMQQARP